MSPTDLLICQIEFGTPEYDQAVALRYEVLRKPLGLNYSPEQLAEEYDQIHLTAYDPGQKLLAYLNLTRKDEATFKMRQVAVAPEAQGKGVGASLVAESERLVARLGARQMTLHARETAVAFYLKQGYRIEGESFEEVGIPHRLMCKDLGD